MYIIARRTQYARIACIRVLVGVDRFVAFFGLSAAQRSLALGYNVVARCRPTFNLFTLGTHSTRAMPSKRPASAALETDDTATIPMPHWDHSPNSLSAYLIALRAWLPTRNAKYITFVGNHTVLDRRTICCRNEAHITAVKSATFAKGSFAEPYLPPDFCKTLAGHTAATALDGRGCHANGQRASPEHGQPRGVRLHNRFRYRRYLAS